MESRFLSLDETKKRLFDRIPDRYHEPVSSISRVETSSDEVSRWLDRCKMKRDEKWLKIAETEIPRDLVEGYRGQIIDIKVGGYGPDDKIYNQHADIREMVARGNTILRLQTTFKDKSSTYDNVIFALRKFTGGLGDEDDDVVDGDTAMVEGQRWENYFLKPSNTAVKVISTHKENGEAAHVSVRNIGGRFYFCIGSKNVHLLVKTREDIQRYQDTRYTVARTVVHAIFDHFDAMDRDKMELFCNFMHYSRLTAVFEILNPNNQHVVDLSNLKTSRLSFICWTLPYGIKKDSLCALSPDIAIEVAKSAFDFTCVEYEIVSPSNLDSHVKNIRSGYGNEGRVLYFVDDQNRTIGIIKKKTLWYIVLRAIRQKVQGHVKSSGKGNNMNAAELKSRIDRRLEELQNWIQFSNDCLSKWKTLSHRFVDWIMNNNNTLEINKKGHLFPVLWTQFLSSCNQTDKIQYT